MRAISRCSVSFAHKAAPDMQIVGPGSVGEGVLMPAMGGGGLAAGLVKTADMLTATPKPTFDVFSYHFYGAASIRCASMGAGAQTAAADALSESWLARTDTSYDFYVKGLRDRYAPGKPVWITETADAACGGNPWAATFLDSFRYLDQLGRLARHGVSVVFHNTLASSEYGLLDQNTFAPAAQLLGRPAVASADGHHRARRRPIATRPAPVRAVPARATGRRDRAGDQQQPLRSPPPSTCHWRPSATPWARRNSKTARCS